jgi:uncharacterized protein with GYD domain
VYIIVDVPDAVTATALSLAVNQTGAAHVKTHVLITPEEVDQASKRSVDYQPPGR